MGTLGYYLAIPFIYVIAWLPFPLLYMLSDVLYFLIFKIIGYRTEVVLTNLSNSFPEKDEAEIRSIASRFLAAVTAVAPALFGTTRVASHTSSISMSSSGARQAHFSCCSMGAA